MPITALYAGLLVPIFIILSARVIRARRGAKVSVGDGGDASLMRRMRVHANFAEYVPLALVLIGLVESMKVDWRLIHALGITLLIARIAHAAGMSPAKDIFVLRVLGVALTFAVLIAAAILCVSGAILSTPFS